MVIHIFNRCGNPYNSSTIPPAPPAPSLPGVMMEYGWWDGDLENKIMSAMIEFGDTRERAIARIFSDGV